MANISTQYLYTGKGPFDAKQLVQTLQKLLDPTSYGNYPYNGMIVGVGLDPTPTNNGVYYLYDETVKNSRGTPDVTKRENWFKLPTIEDINVAVNNSNHLTKEVDTENNLIKLDGSEEFTSAQANVIYLKYSGENILADNYFEYTLINGKLTLIGSTSVNLDNYISYSDTLIIDGGTALN